MKFINLINYSYSNKTNPIIKRPHYINLSIYNFNKFQIIITLLQNMYLDGWGQKFRYTT